MSTRVVSVAALCVLLFASPALVGCSSSHHAARSSAAQPKSRLIVLGQSMAGVPLAESRKSVEVSTGIEKCAIIGRRKVHHSGLGRASKGPFRLNQDDRPSARRPLDGLLRARISAAASETAPAAR